MYYIAKYMEDARATASAADPVWGQGGGLTPLAAVAAAKWRQTVRDRQAQRLAAEKVAEEEEAEARVLRGMEQLLGKGAARAWAEARRAAAPAAAAGQLPGAGPVPPGVREGQHDSGSAAAAGGEAKTPISASVSVGTDGGGAGANPGGTLANGTMLQGAPALLATTTSSAAPGAAAAATAAAAARAASVGKGVISGSAMLLEELAKRTSLEVVLADVAAAAARRGLPRRLSRKASLQITREVNRR